MTDDLEETDDAMDDDNESPKNDPVPESEGDED
jgi:hypothetical protein